MNNSNIQKIGIILYGLLGDVLMRTPLLEVLRNNFKNTEFYFFVDPIGKSVLETNPVVKEIIVTDRTKSNKINYIKNKVFTQIQLRKLNLDMIFNFYGGKSAHNMMRLSGVKYQIGFKNGELWTNSKDIVFNTPLEDMFLNEVHLTNRLYPILSFLDIDFKKVSTKPIIYSSKKSDDKMKSYIDSLENFNEYYLLSLGSGGLEKLVSMKKMYILIEYIYDNYRLKPAVVLNPGQEFLQEELIRDFLEPNKLDYLKLEYLSISELTSLMKLSKFIIVPDTGLYHMAVAIGIPIFSIFAYTNPQLVQPESGTFELCYEEIEELDAFGLKKCTNSISLEKIHSSFQSFYKKLLNTDKS